MRKPRGFATLRLPRDGYQSHGGLHGPDIGAAGTHDPVSTLLREAVRIRR
ncbi:MAG TPA: hypothetical protein VJ827_12285 [Rubrobacter sp.]|nr:hypothetical protein [Rubrobacter sp.]